MPLALQEPLKAVIQSMLETYNEMMDDDSRLTLETLRLKHFPILFSRLPEQVYQIFSDDSEAYEQLHALIMPGDPGMLAGLFNHSFRNPADEFIYEGSDFDDVSRAAVTRLIDRYHAFISSSDKPAALPLAEGCQDAAKLCRLVGHADEGHLSNFFLVRGMASDLIYSVRGRAIGAFANVLRPLSLPDRPFSPTAAFFGKPVTFYEHAFRNLLQLIFDSDLSSRDDLQAFMVFDKARFDAALSKMPGLPLPTSALERSVLQLMQQLSEIVAVAWHLSEAETVEQAAAVRQEALRRITGLKSMIGGGRINGQPIPYELQVLLGELDLDNVEDNLRVVVPEGVEVDEELSAHLSQLDVETPFSRALHGEVVAVNPQPLAQFGAGVSPLVVLGFEIRMSVWESDPDMEDDIKGEVEQIIAAVRACLVQPIRVSVDEVLASIRQAITEAPEGRRNLQALHDAHPTRGLGVFIQMLDEVSTDDAQKALFGRQLLASYPGLTEQEQVFILNPAALGAPTDLMLCYQLQRKVQELAPNLLPAYQGRMREIFPSVKLPIASLTSWVEYLAEQNARKTLLLSTDQVRDMVVSLANSPSREAQLLAENVLSSGGFFTEDSWTKLRKLFRDEAAVAEGRSPSPVLGCLVRSSRLLEGLLVAEPPVAMTGTTRDLMVEQLVAACNEAPIDVEVCWLLLNVYEFFQENKGVNRELFSPQAYATFLKEGAPLSEARCLAVFDRSMDDCARLLRASPDDAAVKFQVGELLLGVLSSSATSAIASFAHSVALVAAAMFTLQRVADRDQKDLVTGRLLSAVDHVHAEDDLDAMAKLGFYARLWPHLDESQREVALGRLDGLLAVDNLSEFLVVSPGFPDDFVAQVRSRSGFDGGLGVGVAVGVAVEVEGGVDDVSVASSAGGGVRGRVETMGGVSDMESTDVSDDEVAVQTPLSIAQAILAGECRCGYVNFDIVANGRTMGELADVKLDADQVMQVQKILVAWDRASVSVELEGIEDALFPCEVEVAHPEFEEAACALRASLTAADLRMVDAKAGSLAGSRFGLHAAPSDGTAAAASSDDTVDRRYTR